MLMVEESSPSLADTQPHRVNLAVNRWRALGCWTKGLIVLGVMLLIPMFLCGAGLLVYVVFPPGQLDILVLGLDSREGEGYFGRADSIMLLGIDPRRLRVNL